MAIVTASPYVKVIVKATELPRELHDQADELLTMAYTEAGYPRESEWDDERHRYMNTTPVPDLVRHRATRLVCDRLGIPYEESDVCPDCGQHPGVCG